MYGMSTCLTDRVSDGLSSLPSGCMEGDSASTELPYCSLIDCSSPNGMTWELFRV